MYMYIIIPFRWSQVDPTCIADNGMKVILERLDSTADTSCFIVQSSKGCDQFGDP